MIWISSAIFALFLIAALVKKYDAKLRYVEWTSKLANEISMDDDDYIKHRGHQLTFTFPGTISHFHLYTNKSVIDILLNRIHM